MPSVPSQRSEVVSEHLQCFWRELQMYYLSSSGTDGEAAASCIFVWTENKIQRREVVCTSSSTHYQGSQGMQQGVRQRIIHCTRIHGASSTRKNTWVLFLCPGAKNSSTRWAKSMLSQSTYSFIHHNCQTEAATQLHIPYFHWGLCWDDECCRFTWQAVFFERLSSVWSPPWSRTHIILPGYCQLSRHYIAKLSEILSKLPHT